jgi:fructose-1,6-bisphosphatase/sedoheptulose 1,7-bisphosphatase-like protein
MARSIMRTVLDHPVHSLDFVKVTESAALAASRWMGRGERDAADGAAVEKMRESLGEMEITGRIVIGEGERDEAPMLYIGEEVGCGGEEVDIAVDPVEGTNLVANGLPNSIAVMAITERGGLRAGYLHEKTGRRPEGCSLRAHRRTSVREPPGRRERT